MKRLEQQKGFTLVELAIVLTIIGLLIGGILKGQQLITNARVTSQIAQINAYKAATTTFTDTYTGLPGDLATASTRIPGCGAGNTNNCASGAGAGIVGAAGTAPAATVISTANSWYWVHMALANLIIGVTPSSTTIIGGQTPYAKINPNAGIVVTQLASVAGAAAPVFSGLYATITMSNTAGAMTGSGLGAGLNAMTPNQAANIDRKMDDGQSQTGGVIAFGPATDCAVATGSGYIESVTTSDCGLDIQIQ